MCQVNPWTVWLNKHWAAIEPVLRQRLQKVFRTERYTGEFDDIIQTFALYLITSDFNRFIRESWDRVRKEPDASLTLRRLDWLAFLCVRKGEGAHREVGQSHIVPGFQLDDETFHVEDPAPNPEDAFFSQFPSQSEKMFASWDCLVRARFKKAPQTLKTWELLRQGHSQVELAKLRGITSQGIHSDIVRLRICLRRYGEANAA